MIRSLFVHKVYTNTPIIIDEDHYSVMCLVTKDDQSIEEATQEYFHFGYEEQCEDFIRLVNNNFEPVELKFTDDEEEEEDSV